MSTSVADPPAKEESPPFKLLLPPEAETAFMPLTWCFDGGREGQRVMEQIVEAKGFTTPYLLIVVRGARDEKLDVHTYRDYVDTACHIVPLRQQMEFIGFRRPGHNEVCAVIFDGASKDSMDQARQIRKWIQAGDNKQADNCGSFFKADGSPSGAITGYMEIVSLPNSRKEIDLDKGMFAKDPPAILDKTVKFFFRGKRGKDECRFWWKLPVALPAAAIWIPLALVVKLVALGGMLLLGLRLNNAQWRLFLRPLRGKPSDLNPGPTIWLKDAKGKFRFGPLNFLNPFFIGAVAGIVYGITRISHTSNEHSVPMVSFTFVECLGWVALGTLGLAGLILVRKPIRKAVGAFCAFVVWLIWQAGRLVAWPFKKTGKWKGWTKFIRGLDQAADWFFGFRVWGWIGTAFTVVLGLLALPFVLLARLWHYFRPPDDSPAKLEAARKRREQEAADAAKRSAQLQAQQVEKRRREQEKKRRLEAELALMTCEGEAKALNNVSELPRGRQTIRLKVFGHKRKHCAPFAS